MLPKDGLKGRFYICLSLFAKHEFSNSLILDFRYCAVVPRGDAIGILRLFVRFAYFALKTCRLK